MLGQRERESLESSSERENQKIITKKKKRLKAHPWINNPIVYDRYYARNK